MQRFKHFRERNEYHNWHESSLYRKLKKDITTEVLLNIHIKYPSVNIMRIITGEGDVLLETNKIQNANIDSSFSLRNIISLKGKIKITYGSWGTKRKITGN